MALKKVFIFFLFGIVFFFVGFKIIGYVVIETSSGVSISAGKIQVIYDEFKGKGSTTDFLYKSDEDLESLMDLTLETNYGKVVFNEVINLTQDLQDNVIDLDNNIGILFNLIEVNTEKLSSLNKSATLTLYGLNFVLPKILKNGVECSSSLCELVNYSNGTLIFIVDSFSSYSVVEGYVESVSGGRRKSVITLEDKEQNFILKRDFIKVLLFQGENIEESVEIENLGEEDLDVFLESSAIKDFLILEKDFFSLKSGETKKINFRFFAREDEFPGAYIGRIIVNSKKVSKTINVVVEIKKKNPIFDVNINILKKEVNAGEKVKAEVNVFNFGNLKDIEGVLSYSILDFFGNVLSSNEEIVLIKTDIKSIKELPTFSDFELGGYLFRVNLNYGDITVSSMDYFIVKEKQFNSYKLILIGIFLFFVLVILFLVFKLGKKLRREKDS